VEWEFSQNSLISSWGTLEAFVEFWS